MAVDLSKVMDLADGLEMYKDLRGRIDEVPTPEDPPVVGLLINSLAMPINDNKFINFGVQNGVRLVMNGSGTGFNLEADIQDIQVDGTSVLQNGIANIPMGNSSRLGVFKISNNEGVGAWSNGCLSINEASSAQIKAGATAAKPIVPYNQHQSAFYALAKAAGADMAQSSNPVGTYTDAAKQAILKMLGLDGILGDFENSAVASKAYAIGETFVYNGKRYRATAAIAISDVIAPGTNCELTPIDGHYVRDTDYAGSTVPGIVCVRDSYGIRMDPTSHALVIQNATGNPVKLGTDIYKPLVPSIQHQSVFFGLSKAAGVDLGNETVTVGTYPATAKAAILAMLGAVKDVQINGTTILTDGIANVPLMTTSTPGVAMKGPGLYISNGTLGVNTSSSNDIKGGLTGTFTQVSKQHEATFYALAKLAGADMAQSSNPVGTFTDAAKVAIQKMFGFDGIFGDYELSATASKAYAVGETFIFNGNRYRATTAIAINDVLAPGTNCVLDPIDEHYVRDTDIASSTKLGLVKPLGNAGVYVTSQGNLCTDKATANGIKAGNNAYNPIVPELQHVSSFYALSKAAGVDLANIQDVVVGVYPQSSKTAIQTMLGIEADIPLVETVTGATASITGMPNVRYICDTAISELRIKPPASGSIVVRFTAGSNCIVALPQTVKLPEWFDISSLEAGTTYEIIITDGVYGGVMSWA